ncbi:MFS transporter [Salinactinospora qingdaonensis]|uniref:MFS transporter n=1 Tax=Salinactinospora qingdaonensis TaxID=702744 RepID=A0ABP7G7Y9_9ACTN
MAQTRSLSRNETQAPTAAAEDTAPPRWKVWLAAWPVTAVFILSNTATPLYVLWQREIGFSDGTLTVIFTSYIAGLLAALLAAGVASDRLGRKPVLLPALTLALIACLIFATASSVLALVVARFLSGVAVGAIVSAGMAAVTDVGGASRTRLASLLASTAMVLGAGLGPLLAGVLSETLPGPKVTIFMVEIVLLAAAFLVVMWLPARRGSAEATRGAGSWVRVPSVPPANRIHLMLGIVVFAPGITATSFVLSLGPSVLAGQLGSDSRIVAGATAFVMFAAATGMQFAVQRLGVRSILLGGAMSTVASMVTLMLAMHTTSVPLLVLAALLAGSGQGMGQLGGLSLLSANVPARRRAEANAGLNVGGYVMAGTLPVAAGYLSDAVGLATGTTIFGTVMLLLALLGGAFVLAGYRRISEHG